MGVPILDILDWTDVSAVLDVGCGNDKWLTEAEDDPAALSLDSISRRRPYRWTRSLGGNVVGGRPAAQRATGAYVMQADAVDLPIADGSFDRVLAMWMLYHVDDHDRAVGELRQVLRPGGQALVVTNGSSHLLELNRLVEAAGSKVCNAESSGVCCTTRRRNFGGQRSQTPRVAGRPIVELLGGRFRRSLPTLFCTPRFDVRRIQLLESYAVFVSTWSALLTMRIWPVEGRVVIRVQVCADAD